jgi:hypothetical protein
MKHHTMDESQCDGDLNDGRPVFGNVIICCHHDIGHSQWNLYKRNIKSLQFSHVGGRTKGHK